MTDSRRLVNQLWSYCAVLREDGDPADAFASSRSRPLGASQSTGATT